MVVCSFAQAAATAAPRTAKSAVPRIAQLVDAEGNVQDVHSLVELLPKPVVREDEAHSERVIETLVAAGRGHYRMYQEEANQNVITCPIVPFTTDMDVKISKTNRCAVLEVKVDPVWVCYAVGMLWEEVEKILVERGACLDLRMILAGSSILRLHGHDQVSLTRSLDKVLRCLSKVLIINNYGSALGTPGLNTPGGFMMHEGGFRNGLMAGRVRTIQPQDSRDLLCGKKDGKLNRIQRESNCRITLRDGDEGRRYFWILMEPSGEGPPMLREALDAMDRELPAELCVHLDDGHHKSLIGVGGSNIQRVMKQHGVYVRFLGSNECAQVLGGDEREWPDAPLSNVLIRTPQRNRDALQAMRADLYALAKIPLPVLQTSVNTPGDNGWTVRQGGQLVQLTVTNGSSNPKKKPELSVLDMDIEELIKEIPDDISLLSSDGRTSPMPEPNTPMPTDNVGYLPMEWIQHDPLYLIRPRSRSLSGQTSVIPSAIGEERSSRRGSI